MIDIRIAESTEDKDIANKIVVDFHSYVNTPKVVGRCIKYVIAYNNKDVATFWLGSGFKPTPKAILNYFNLSQKEFDKIFNEVADNKRFCIKENPVNNLGSQILSRIRKRAKADWFHKYGNNLKGILTTIGNDKNGSVYLADNWQVIGKTSGLPKRNKSVSMKWNNKEEIAERFVKPTGENKKLILITTAI